MDSRKLQLFKTELCRNWQEMGSCRYDKKCRFAHGEEELRCVQRHAKYKTEICRTFHLTGTCHYGVRCTFIHDEQPSSFTSSPMFKSPPSSNATTFEEEFNAWKNNKLDPLVANIWSASLLDRRYSSSSSSSSSPFLS